LGIVISIGLKVNPSRKKTSHLIEKDYIWKIERKKKKAKMIRLLMTSGMRGRSEHLMGAGCRLDMSHLPAETRQLITGMPKEHQDRHVVIYQPSKNAMQSGRNASESMWHMEYLGTQNRWDNPLMGWTSSRDPVSRLKMEFESKQEAQDYCEGYGISYVVHDKTEERARPDDTDERLYDDNFAFRPPEKTTEEELF
jgi:NADH dehydrogenase ubiquinone Fe-S protein 4